MSERALKNIIAQAISNINSNTGKKYVSLSEIYEEVEKIKKEPITDAVKAQVRARLQESCSSCSSYLGKDDFFETKGNGLWI